MTQIMGSPHLTNLTPIQEPEYDGKENVRPDRKCGWKIRHSFLPGWIEGIPSRLLADQIAEAFSIISEGAFAEGKMAK